MKNKIWILFAVAIVAVGCNDFLTPEPLATEKLEDYYKNDTAAIRAVNAAYAPLEWQLGDTYSNDWFIGDVVSDDALKGGASVSDMQVILLMENFQTTANNEYLNTVYDICYQGIFRCNFAIENINAMKDVYWTDQNLKQRLLAESRFLRAFYHFRLTRIFGNIIKGDRTFNQHDTRMPRVPQSEIFTFITHDLNFAMNHLPLKSEYPISGLGRATKGAAQALMMRVLQFNIRQSPNKTRDHERVVALGDSIFTSSEYGLMATYGMLWEPEYSPQANLKYENNKESVFEIQYIEEATSDYGGLGRTRGNFDQSMQRTRTSNQGWGFNRPSQDLYEAFELKDPRRDETILPHDGGDIYGTESNYNNGYHSRKPSLAILLPSGKFTYPALAHATRSPANVMIIRYADVLLMYAESACELNQLVKAKDKLNEVRLRAKQSNPATAVDVTTLMPYPYGGYSESSQQDLLSAIRHERRVEFAMEGHRWYDLIRWGIAAETMNGYRVKYADREGRDMSNFVEGKHELFPIPEKQLNNNPLLDQNYGY